MQSHPFFRPHENHFRLVVTVPLLFVVGLTGLLIGSTSDGRTAPQSVVLQLVDVKGDPPCSTWNITTCDPNGGKITWAQTATTTYTWTAPPQQIGPEGVTISLNVSVSKAPPGFSNDTGLRLTATGFDLTGDTPDAPVKGQNSSGSATVTIKPHPGTGEYSIGVSVYYGPSYIYHYRAVAASNPLPQTDQPAAPRTPENKPGSSDYDARARLGDIIGRMAGPENNASAPRATIRAFHGDVSVRPAGGTFEDLTTTGRQLREGDDISTGPDGTVTLTFSDGSTVVVDQNTQMNIGSFLRQRGDVRVRVNLKIGKVAARVAKSETSNPTFNVRTPNMTASDRGTAFTVRYDKQTQTTTVAVEEGTVDVTPENSSLQAVSLRAGQQVQVTQSEVGPIVAVNGGTTGAPRANSATDRTNFSGRWSGSWTNSKGESGQSTISINDAGDGTITGDEDSWAIENGHRYGNRIIWEYNKQNKGCTDYTVVFEISQEGRTANGSYTAKDRCTGQTYTGRYINYRR
jgi:hypothetical protein